MFFLARDNKVFLFGSGKDNMTMVFESEEGNVLKLYSFCNRDVGDDDILVFVAIVESGKSYLCFTNSCGGEVRNTITLTREDQPIDWFYGQGMGCIAALYTDRIVMFNILVTSRYSYPFPNESNDDAILDRIIYSNIKSSVRILASNGKLYVFHFCLYTEVPVTKYNEVQYHHFDIWSLYQNGELYVNESEHPIDTNVSKAVSPPHMYPLQCPIYYLVGDSLYIAVVGEVRKAFISDRVSNIRLGHVLYVLKNKELFYLKGDNLITTNFKGDIIFPITCDFDAKRQDMTPRFIKRAIQ